MSETAPCPYATIPGFHEIVCCPACKPKAYQLNPKQRRHLEEMIREPARMGTPENKSAARAFNACNFPRQRA